MVGFQQVNGVHGQTSRLVTGQAQTVFLPLSLTLLEHFPCLFQYPIKSQQKQWVEIDLKRRLSCNLHEYPLLFNAG
jgi:hypothetical protein